ncbi:MAG TPA: hypothetical protein VGG92_02990, partial [Caulobacteraceae bacterium]
MVSGVETRSHCYLDLAKSYGQAASQIASTVDLQGTRSPFFMLVSHAVELSLKAVIAAGGTDDERLLNLGHDLQLCMRFACARGLAGDSGDPNVVAILGALGPPHMAQAFRYPSYLSWSLPNPTDALDALARLLARTEGVVNPLRHPWTGEVRNRTRGPTPLSTLGRNWEDQPVGDVIVGGTEREQVHRLWRLGGRL